MPRGYRLLGFAALAAALLTAFLASAYLAGLQNPEQSERYQTYQSRQAEEQGALPAVADVPIGIVQRTPCKNPQSETESDLCAQWRAAKAAEKSAQWTVFGVIASVVGISLLLWQVVLTRAAVEDTGKATHAMERQNEIAHWGQRPWVTIQIEPAIFRLKDKGFFQFDVVLTNIGKSPAICLNFIAEATFGHMHDEDITHIVWQNSVPIVPNSKVNLLPSDQHSRGFTELVDFGHGSFGSKRPESTFDPIVTVSVFYKTNPEQSDWNRTAKSFVFRRDGVPINFIDPEILAPDLVAVARSGTIAT